MSPAYCLLAPSLPLPAHHFMLRPLTFLHLPPGPPDFPSCLLLGILFSSGRVFIGSSSAKFPFGVWKNTVYIYKVTDVFIKKSRRIKKDCTPHTTWSNFIKFYLRIFNISPLSNVDYLRSTLFLFGGSVQASFLPQ